MRDEDAAGPESIGVLRKRRELMADGRYLIYFTFEGGGNAPAAEAEQSRPGPKADPEAEEERRV